MLLLNGRDVALMVKTEVTNDAKRFKERFKKPPQLAVISIGSDPASQIYMRNKERAALEAGLAFQRYSLDNENSQEELDSLIIKLNTDSDVHGFLVQLPIPRQFNLDSVYAAMNPWKDADGFLPENLGLLLSGKPRVKPCTPFGIMKMLEHYKIPVSGKKAVVVGRSTIVGKPMAQLLLNADATVTVCHTKTANLKEYTTGADIVVVAAGRVEFLDESFFSSHSVVIDVGMHHLDGRMTGDVLFSSVSKKVAALTPVPGGVGQMTVAMLLRNTVDLAFAQEEKRST